MRMTDFSLDFVFAPNLGDFFCDVTMKIVKGVGHFDKKFKCLKFRKQKAHQVVLL